MMVCDASFQQYTIKIMAFQTVMAVLMFLVTTQRVPDEADTVPAVSHDPLSIVIKPQLGSFSLLSRQRKDPMTVLRSFTKSLLAVRQRTGDV